MYNKKFDMISENLKYYRHSRGFTLDTLGKMINKTKATVSKYEKGEIIPDIITILEICDALQISISQLFPIDNFQENRKSLNPFNSNIIYMYYYTENKLITSILEITETVNEINVKYFNGVKDVKKYFNNSSYIYDGILQCDKTIGYFNLTNRKSSNIQLEKLQISFIIPWSNTFDITNCFILGLTPNSCPIIKKGILSMCPLDNINNFEYDLKISENELRKIKHDNGWILENKNYNHFFYDI